MSLKKIEKEKAELLIRLSMLNTTIDEFEPLLKKMQHDKSQMLLRLEEIDRELSGQQKLKL